VKYKLKNSGTGDSRLGKQVRGSQKGGGRTTARAGFS